MKYDELIMEFFSEMKVEKNKGIRLKDISFCDEDVDNVFFFCDGVEDFVKNYDELIMEFFSEMKVEKNKGIRLKDISFCDEDVDNVFFFYDGVEDFVKNYIVEDVVYTKEEDYERIYIDTDELIEYLADDFDEWINKKGYHKAEQQIMKKEFEDQGLQLLEVYIKKID